MYEVIKVKDVYMINYDLETVVYAKIFTTLIFSLHLQDI